jgi:outer membrane protein assembly factor BamA
MLKAFPTACAAAVVFLVVCSPVMAQNAAGDQPAAQSQADQPPGAPAQATDQPPVVQKIRSYIEKNPIVQRFHGDGFYPRIGGLSPGSGLAGGGGYRRHLDWAYVDVSGAVSTKAYRGIDATVGWIDTKYVDVSTKLTFRNNTQDDFYGLGIDTTDATRVDFGIRSTDVSTRAAAHVTPWLRLGADVGYYVPAVRHGRDDHLRTIEAVFTDATAPGLARQPHFVHDSVFAEVDSRDAHGFPRRGGFYRATYSLWNDRTFDEYDFRRIDLVGSQFVSLTPKSVVALRLDLIYANNAPGDRVPFYLLPYVGGGDTVRAFREFRFRDENAGVFNVELRRKIHPMAHVAAFVDVGKVAHDWQDINPMHVKRAYGFGLRGGSDDRLYLRFDVAYGDDGTRVFLKFTPAF